MEGGGIGRRVERVKKSNRLGGTKYLQFTTRRRIK